MKKFIYEYLKKFDFNGSCFYFDTLPYDDNRNFLVIDLTHQLKGIQDDIFKTFGGIIIYPNEGTNYIGFEWLPNETMDDFLIRMTPIFEEISKKLAELYDNNLSL